MSLTHKTLCLQHYILAIRGDECSTRLRRCDVADDIYATQRDNLLATLQRYSKEQLVVLATIESRHYTFMAESVVVQLRGPFHEDPVQ